MSAIESFDILVFGGGKAGKTLAMDQAKAGKRVAVVEAGMIGGSCINVACIPSKTLIRSAEVAHALRNSGEFGMNVEYVLPNLERVRDRTARVVAEMVATNQAGFDRSGFELVVGWGRFVGQKTIEVNTATGTRTLTGERVYVNLGTTAAIPDIPGLADADPITHVEALKLGDMPSRLIVLGGGYIGMELGQAFRRLGSEVVILDRGTRLAAREDDDVGDAIRSILEAEGLEIAFDCDVSAVSGRSGNAVSVETRDGRIFEGSHLLVATGRRPMTSDIGMELAGIELTPQGFVVVDQHLQTSAPGVWAMGEVAGTPMFTHASLDDYRVVASQLRGGSRVTTGRIIPYCVFIDPEFARVGLNEKEARKNEVGYRLAKLSMDVVPRARTLSRRQGFMKALVAVETDEILGFSMLGTQAGEVMTAVQMAMLGKLPYQTVRDAIVAHPTLSEGLGMLFGTVNPT